MPFGEALRGRSPASALEWGSEKVADGDRVKTKQAKLWGPCVGGELEVFAWVCLCAHPERFPKTVYHVEQGSQTPVSLGARQGTSLGQIFPLTGICIKLGGRG